jgi:hypothetical protein
MMEENLCLGPDLAGDYWWNTKLMTGIAYTGGETSAKHGKHTEMLAVTVQKVSSKTMRAIQYVITFHGIFPLTPPSNHRTPPESE